MKARLPKEFHSNGAKLLVLICALVLLGVLYAPTATMRFSSAEIGFTDTSRGGLAIVPASCESEPPYPHVEGECDSAISCTLTASQEQINAGGSFTLSWVSTRIGPMLYPEYHFFDGTINEGVGAVSDSGAVELGGSVLVNVPDSQAAGPLKYTLSGEDYFLVNTYKYYPMNVSCDKTVNITNPPPEYKCTGDTPANADLCSGDDEDLSRDWPRRLSRVCNTLPKCEYICAEGYRYSGGQCVQDDPFVCTGDIADHSELCAGDADGLTKNIERRLAAACSTPQGSPPKCQYTCLEGYSKVGDECVPDQEFVCLGTPPANASLCEGDADNLTQDAARSLATACSIPQGSPPKCQYTCDSGYVKQGNECVPVGYRCVGLLPPHSYLCSGDAEGLTQDTTRTLKEACSLPHGSAPKCEFICLDGYELVGGQCVIDPNPSRVSAYITASPALVRLDEKTNVLWSYNDMTECSVSGTNGDSWTAGFTYPSMATTSRETTEIERATIYTLGCTDKYGRDVKRTATVNLIPEWIEQ
ncbi:MAG TPA: hypothetical protein VJB97_01665 [Candidatus Paceibacterota bacterium]